MEETITKIENGKKYIYNLTKIVEPEIEDKIKIILERREKLVRDCTVEKYYEGSYKAEFYMKSDCDIVQSFEVVELKRLGYIITCVHPYPNERISLIIDRL